MIKQSITLAILMQMGLAFGLVLQPKAPGCSISISALDPEPIVVSGPDNSFVYAEPTATTISVAAGEVLLVSCPGGQLSAGPLHYVAVNATCVSGTQFTVGSTTVDFSTISCSRSAFHTARYTGKSCEANGLEIEVGFLVDEDILARELTICFDLVTLNPLYSAFHLTKSIGHHESGVSRPSFIEDSFYNLPKKVNDLYVRNGQRSTINRLLGLPENSTKYIQDNDNYLARGHLSAKADFVYAPQQTATFHYVNAAPQWQTFNGKNWEVVESDVRAYVEKNGLDLNVFTGTYGVTTLPHETTGEEVPLYLYVDGNDKALPVPELYWKAVYDPLTKKGVVLLGINNPYQDDVKRSVICTDVSTQLTWLNWKKDSIEEGYSYACTVDDFRKRVDYLPEFDVTELLL